MLASVDGDQMNNVMMEDGREQKGSGVMGVDARPGDACRDVSMYIGRSCASASGRPPRTDHQRATANITQRSTLPTADPTQKHILQFHPPSPLWSLSDAVRLQNGP